jgi:hypothetical protein
MATPLDTFALGAMGLLGILDPFAQQAYFKPAAVTNPSQVGNFFGHSVAASGDTQERTTSRPKASKVARLTFLYAAEPPGSSRPGYCRPPSAPGIRKTGSAGRSRSRATRSWWERSTKTAIQPASTACPTSCPRKPARPTYSSGTGRPGPAGLSQARRGRRLAGARSLRLFGRGVGRHRRRRGQRRRQQQHGREQRAKRRSQLRRRSLRIRPHRLDLEPRGVPQARRSPRNPGVRQFRLVGGGVGLEEGYEPPAPIELPAWCSARQLAKQPVNGRSPCVSRQK